MYFFLRVYISKLPVFLRGIPTNFPLFFSLKNKKSGINGFSFIELIVVLMVIAILAAAIIPSFIGYIKNAKKAVCDSNCAQLERMYGTYLILENAAHSGNMFLQYMQEYGKSICPDGHDIRYFNEDVQCLVHSSGDNSENDEGNGGDDGTVPIL